MKLLQSIVICVALLLTPRPGLAQKDRILVYSWDFSVEADLMVTFLSGLVDADIEKVDVLPADLSNYAAICVMARYTMLPSSSDSALIEYIEAGGKIFMEGMNASHSEDSSTLLGRVGLQQAVSGMLADRSVSITGVHGRYTESFSIGSTNTNPLETDFDGPMMVTGLIPVLMLNGSIIKSECAWISNDASLRFVLFARPRAYSPESFIALTFCKYFQFCILDVAVRVSDRSTISFDPTRSELQLPASGFITITDILGHVVSTQYVEDNKYKIPSSLTKGSHFVRWRSASASASLKIAVE